MKKTTLENWLAKKICVEKLSKENLREYQLNQIKNTVEYAKAKSSFYKDLFHDIDTTNFSWEKFVNIPFSDSQNLKEQGSKMLCVTQDDIYRIVTLSTSGTTDKPKRVYFTKADQELTIDFFCNGMQNITTANENFLILLPTKTPGCVGDLLRQGIERFGVIAHPYSVPTDFEHTLNYMIENQITGVLANPEHLLALAELADMKGIKHQLNSVLMATDYIAESLKKRIAEVFGCTVFQHYGMTEMGLLGGVSCSAKKGYHTCEGDLYIEIIDPKTGKNLPDGSWGEIVFTTLTREAMPFIRYRTGDSGRFLVEPCACGTIMRTLDKVSHRLDGNNFNITDFDEAIFAIKGIFNYDIQIDKEKQIISINAYILNDHSDYINQVIKAVKPIAQGYNVKAKTTIGFNSGHYQLRKRKIDYVLCSRRN